MESIPEYHVPKGVVLVLILFLCAANSPIYSDKAKLLSTGPGRFVFTDVKGNRNKPITVWYYQPKDLLPTARVVFVMHGVKRNGKEYRDKWIKHAQRGKFLLVVPEFSEKYYKGSKQYNLGNMFTSSGARINESKWSFSAIEHLFDHIKRSTHLTSPTYDIYGHSAGAQFVHRLILFKPKARINKAISANAGWYTFPTFRKAFPYGLRKSPAKKAYLKKALGKKLIILLYLLSNYNQDNMCRLFHR
ncbi:hypothetical protein LCGC14_2677920 [marine sediment metagenome]|uniref:Alpha/beta hydrolase n=1 Tax=marine sediment metagenome TaxID=412755 RepID=A0A0F9BX37_9ZZZZ